MKAGITINERLAKVREALGHSPKAFADILGVSRPYLANIESARRDVGLDVVKFLIETLSVAPDYILFGRGSMFHYGTSKPVIEGETVNLSANPSANPSANLSTHSKTKRTKSEEKPVLTVWRNDNLRVLVTTVDKDDNENISLVSTRVAAGYASGGFHEPEFVRDLPTFSLPDRAFKNGTFRAFQVSGESMQPTLYEGDWVICRFVDQWDRDIRDTFVHVIVTEEMPLVKRLLNRLNDRGQISLLSDNPAFPTQFIDGADVREVWVAVGRLSRQFANPRYDLVQEMSRTRSDVDELMAQFQTMQQQLGLKPV